MRRHIIDRLARAELRPLRSDFDVDPALAGLAGLAGRTRDPRQAAVLVPIVERAQAMTVLLTQRTEHLPDHPGQISFPGGSVEPFDTDPVDTALRETEEEVGIARRHVDVVGRLDTYETATGFHVTPVVGLLTPPFTVAADPHEVAAVFEVPLDFVLDPANHQRHSRDYKGGRRFFYAMPYGDFYIWGATAHMLVNLSEVLRASAQEAAS